jgi:hypothetical protein
MLYASDLDVKEAQLILKSHLTPEVCFGAPRFKDGILYISMLLFVVWSYFLTLFLISGTLTGEKETTKTDP